MRPTTIKFDNLNASVETNSVVAGSLKGDEQEFQSNAKKASGSAFCCLNAPCVTVFWRRGMNSHPDSHVWSISGEPTKLRQVLSQNTIF